MRNFYFKVEISFMTESKTIESFAYYIQASGQDVAKYMAHNNIRLHNADPKQEKIRQPEIIAVELVPSF